MHEGAPETWYNWGVEKLARQLEKNDDWPFNLMENPRVREAFLSIDRKDFVPEYFQHLAYEDQPLPIGKEQTISQPSVVAFMLSVLDAKPGDKIMDVGAGSGWQAALLAYMVGDEGRINALEVVPELCRQAQSNLEKYEFTNIEVICGNARSNLPDVGLLDGIISAATTESIPEEWKSKLSVGGRIVTPMKDPDLPNTDRLVVATKLDDGKFNKEAYRGFVFVPLVSES